MARYEKKRSNRGCCCSFFTFIFVGIVILCLLFFCTDALSGIKTKVLKYYYPIEYSEYVEEYSAKYEVEQSLVYAVIHTESGFRAEVESSAGAMGLMQLMPDTFDWLQTLDDDEYTYPESQLLNPVVNIEYGTLYLSILLDHYDGNELLAVAAYNGGFANVDSWLDDERYSSDGITLSDIPYNETSQYVERVEEAKQMYETLYFDNN